MSFLSRIFGSKTVATHAVPSSPKESGTNSLREEVERQIEITEGELHDANSQLATATDAEIKASMQLVVVRKTQALVDLQQKLKKL